MRTVLFIAAVILLVADLPAQIQSYNKAFIWRGFQHQWTYNHRCNRMGNYVQFNNADAQAVHTSATCLGPDSTYYTSLYTYISTPDAVFKEGVAKLKIEGKEKHLNEQTITVSVSADSWLKNKGDYVTLLNGFDLRSNKAADKIQMIRLSVEDSEYITLTNEIRFKVNASFVFNCQSVECPDFNNKVDYDLDIYYIIVGLSENRAVSTEQIYSRSFSWDKNEEVKELPQEKIVSGQGNSSFPEAATGIKSFSVTLNEAHWIVEINNNVTPVNYDAASGDMHLSVDLFIKEWQEGMKGSDAAPVKSKFAVKRKGWAVMDMGVVLLQFNKATVIHKTNSGTMYWKGANEKPEGAAAKSVFSIGLN